MHFTTYVMVSRNSRSKVEMMAIQQTCTIEHKTRGAGLRAGQRYAEPEEMVTHSTQWGNIWPACFPDNMESR